MLYNEWEEKVLAENSFVEIVDDFRRSADLVWHVDRHVVDSVDDIPELENSDKFMSACCAAMAMLDEWSEFTNNFTDNSVFATPPYLVIDDEWLNREVNPPPPHVFICLAKQSKYLRPTLFYNATPGTGLQDERLKELLLGKGYETFRIQGTGDEQGCWIIMH